MKAFLAGIFLGGLALFGILVALFYQQIQAPLPLSSQIVFQIAKRESVRDISVNLQKNGIVKDARIFYWYTKLLKKDRMLQAGFYEVAPPLRLKDLIALLENGTNASIKVTIPEGFTLGQIVTRLEEKGLKIDEDDFTLLPEDVAIYPFLEESPEGAPLEGFLFPSTYTFLVDASPQDIRKTFLTTFQKRFNPAWYEIAQSQGKNILEVVTMASILEKELVSLKDRKIASGILWRRLLVGMPLQVDSTINYVTGKNLPAVGLDDLQTDSPYNTYRHKGLPPGPISNPGVESIEAALFPEASDHWFYLSRQDNGQTVFSKTLQDHARAKAKYLR